MISHTQRKLVAELQDTGRITGAIAAPGGKHTRILAWGGEAAAKTREQALASLPAELRALAVDVDTTEDRSTYQGSRTDRALALLDEHPAMRPHEAAVRIGVSPSAVYRALARSRRPLCPACHRPLETHA